jgi:hypothetical protein
MDQGFFAIDEHFVESIGMACPRPEFEFEGHICQQYGTWHKPGDDDCEQTLQGIVPHF